MAKGKKFVKLNWGIQIKKETTPNTYITPTNAVCVERGKGTIGNPAYNKYTCDMMSAFDGDVYDIVTDSDSGKVEVTLDIAVPKTNTPLIADLLEGCGVFQSPAKSYRPKTANDTRLSLLVSQLRRQYKIKGAVGNLKIIMKAGEMVRFQVSLTGGLASDVVEKTKIQPDFAIVKDVLNPDDILWIKSKCGIAVNGEQYWVSSAEFDFGIEFSTKDDYCGKITRITNRKSSLKITYKNTEENETPLSDLKNATSYNIVIDLHDNNGTKVAELAVPNAKVSEDTPTEVDGYLETTRDYTAVSVTGDDNFTYKYL